VRIDEELMEIWPNEVCDTWLEPYIRVFYDILLFFFVSDHGGLVLIYFLFLATLDQAMLFPIFNYTSSSILFPSLVNMMFPVMGKVLDSSYKASFF